MSSLPNHIVLYDIPWDAYTKMMDAFGEKHLSHVYQHGTLEMMSPSEEHDWIARFLDRLIGTASMELDVPILSVGSATRRIKRLEHALEPDESYYIGRESIARARRRSSADRKHAAPDLVVEVEWSRAVLSKLESYAVLGVPEVWRYRKGKVDFHLLGTGGTYSVVKNSLAFPLLSSADVTRFVKRLPRSADENQLIKSFLVHLRKLRDHA
jgi:Uma2 family endonuclease